MVEWAASGDRVCGFGENGTVTVGVDCWVPGGSPPSLDVAVDASVVGTTGTLEVPGSAARRPSTGRPLEDGDRFDGVTRIDIDAAISVRVAFDGAGSVRLNGGTRIDFDEPTPVVIGFREAKSPRPTVTVPATPAGLATAVTAAGRTHRQDGPERSHPGFRPRTPHVEFGEHSVPESLDAPSGPIMTVPESPLAVLVAAPLAYYLGAELRISEGPPHVRGDGADHAFEPLPAFAGDVAEALGRLCYLDTRLRSVPGETTLPVDGFDADALRSAPVTARLSAVIDSSSTDRPTWPLSTYVGGDVANGRYLPYLLDRLSLVFPASASSLDPQAFLKRSLDEFYRGDAPFVDAVDPSLSAARYHAWLGEGTPVDAYTMLGSPTPRDLAGLGSGNDVESGSGLQSGNDVDSGTADDSESGSGTAPGDRLVIDIVCNEPEMAGERDAATAYRRRFSGSTVDVRIHERLSTSELAAVLERGSDLLHFIGHCEAGGLVCPDGEFAAADLDACGVESFFLNACGSYYEGYDLVRRGATVGAVTLKSVLDEQAVTLGRTFAGLLAAGFAFDRALSLARGEIIVGRDYVVVGDGTHRLRPPRGTPGVFHVERVSEGFKVRFDGLSPDGAGRRYVDPTDGQERVCGLEQPTTVDRSELVELLERFALPVRYEGRLEWSDDLAETLAFEDDGDRERAADGRE